MKDLINKIIANKINLYFISPHLDDAMLSCGDLIIQLADKTNVSVINVFTEISAPPFTLSARTFLKQCKRTDAEKLFQERREEDKKVFESIGVTVKNLGFVDAQWRKKERLNFIQKKLAFILPEIIHIYPVYRWHIINGKISDLDRGMMNNIKIDILDIVSKDKNCLVFCPVAVGGNVDHRIVRDCCLDIFDKNLILWSDFPYDSKSKIDFKNILKYREVSFNSDKLRKEELLKMYGSQFEALVKDGMGEFTDERYYLKNSI
jgi:LmbE family N-acetylglucosaminyl deacetylase